MIHVAPQEVDAVKSSFMISTDLSDFIERAKAGIDTIPADRIEKLDVLCKYVQDRVQEDSIDLIFICVHNSRRSHLSQMWAQVAAYHYGYRNVRCYSGGTEVTAMFKAAKDTLASNGFQVQTLSTGDNPIYALKYEKNAPAIIGFSKIFDDPFNPKSNFGAIMVCSAADANCPYIADANQRILIPFEDPKEFDGTPVQMEKYNERSLQIATEMFYVFSNVNHG